MGWLEYLADPHWQRLTLALLHVLWQGCAVWALTFAAVRLLGLRHGRGRYGAYVVAMVVLTACPAFTFMMLDPPAVACSGAQLDASHHSPLFLYGLQQTLHAWLPWLTAAWLAGVVALLLRLALGVAVLERICRRAMPIPEQLAARARTLANRLGLDGFTAVFASAEIREPLAHGWFRPVVLVPLSLLSGQPPEIVEAIIAHELAHIRRHDIWVNVFQRLVESLLFFHPAVWWISRRLEQEREVCCDDLAIAVTGRRQTYATALERVASALVEPRLLHSAVGMGGETITLRQRVGRILTGGGLPPAPRRVPAGFAAVAALVLLLAGGQLVKTGATPAAARRPASGKPMAIAPVEARTGSAIAPAPAAGSTATREVAKTAPASSQKPTLALFDVNQNGRLDDDERAAIEQAYQKHVDDRKGRFLKKYDRNGDGRLDDGEKRAARRKNWAERAGRRHRGRGQGYSEANSNKSERAKRHEQWHRFVLEKYDTDKDGKLDDAERAAWKNARAKHKSDRWKRIVRKYDTNGDGRLDDHERMAMRLAKSRARSHDRT